MITPEFIQGSFWFVMATYIVALGFQIYMMYLNWKQSKVNNQMEDVVKELRAIHSLLEKK